MSLSNAGRRSNKQIPSLIKVLERAFVKRRKNYKKRKSRKLKYGSVAVAFVFLCIVTYSFVHQLNQTNKLNINQEFSFKAAIVDHLILSEPNKTLIQTSIALLEKAGFTVDYYKGEEVTVEFYRNLPTHGYGLIVLRVHSAATPPPLCLFTSELHSKTKYVYEQLTDQVVIVSIYKEIGPFYFGIAPKFVKESMKGNFQNTIILMMGCDGLKYDEMAKAFVEKGANVYISWDGGVSIAHTDKATTHLLQQLTAKKQTVKKAVTETMEEVGPDPLYKSVLLYYPIEAGNYIIPKSPSNLIINVSEINVQYFKKDNNVIGFLSSQLMGMDCCE